MVAAEKNCIFKLYFQNESDCDDADDVRKVVLGQPKTQLSLETVVNKIDQLSILGLEPDFTIQYCDQDGDKVTIGNTEELQNALNDQVNKTENTSCPHAPASHIVDCIYFLN
jgi:hypothetical protein